MEFLPFKDNSFDVVICLEGMEHVELEICRRFIEEVRRVLTPYGLLIATVPLLSEGKHSGNPFHIHEFEKQEAEQMLCEAFRKKYLEEFDGPGAREIRFVGENRKSGGPLT